jgi:hypothetical protein
MNFSFMQDINADAVFHSNGRTRFQQGELGKSDCHTATEHVF